MTGVQTCALPIYFEQKEELLRLDDNIIVIEDDFLKNLDKELDDFLKNLLADV